MSHRSWSPLAALLSRTVAFALILGCDSATDGDTQQPPDTLQNPPPNVEVEADVVASALDTVWELAWGPDGMIWMTERGGRISRVNPQSGAVSVVGTVPVSEVGEGGLLRVSIHKVDYAERTQEPDLLVIEP